MKIKAIIHQAEEGGYWAEVPALPGCYTQGETIEEITQNLKEAAEGWLETEYSKCLKEQGSKEVIEVTL